MSLFAPRTAPAAPATRECIACKRTEQRPAVALETRRIGDGTTALLCVNPSECKRHWPNDYGPWPYEVDLELDLTDELGVRALGADATPAQRARAEAVWHSVKSGFPCRCSGPCHHDQPCGRDLEDGSTCPGRDIHVDRHAASMLSLIRWQDSYECDTCSSTWIGHVDLPDLPFGEDRPGRTFPIRHIYPDTRHPNYPSSWPGASTGVEIEAER